MHDSNGEKRRKAYTTLKFFEEESLFNSITKTQEIRTLNQAEENYQRITNIYTNISKH